MNKMTNMSHGDESKTLCAIDTIIKECGSHGKME
jgi:hypothetical protein